MVKNEDDRNRTQNGEQWWPVIISCTCSAPLLLLTVTLLTWWRSRRRGFGFGLLGTHCRSRIRSCIVRWPYPFPFRSSPYCLAPMFRINFRHFIAEISLECGTLPCPFSTQGKLWLIHFLGLSKWCLTRKKGISACFVYHYVYIDYWTWKNEDLFYGGIHDGGVVATKRFTWCEQKCSFGFRVVVVTNTFMPCITWCLKH